MSTIITSICTFILGIVIGIISIKLLDNIDRDKLRFRKYKKYIYSTLMESTQEMDNNNMSIEDFEDNIIQNCVYLMVIKYNINNIDSLIIYEAIYDYIEKNPKLNIKDTIKLKYTKIDNSKYENETHTDMPEKFSLPTEIYQDNLTNPFRMSNDTEIDEDILLRGE